MAVVEARCTWRVLCPATRCGAYIYFLAEQRYLHCGRCGRSIDSQRHAFQPLLYFLVL